MRPATPTCPCCYIFSPQAASSLQEAAGILHRLLELCVDNLQAFQVSLITLHMMTKVLCPQKC